MCVERNALKTLYIPKNYLICECECYPEWYMKGSAIESH